MMNRCDTGGGMGRGYTRAKVTRVRLCAAYVCLRTQGVELLSNVKCQEDDREVQMQALRINLLTNQVQHPYRSTPNIIAQYRHRH
jgi:hypothetical protein